MKKLLSWLLLIMLIVSLSACGASPISVGRWKNGVYSNDSLSLCFKLPASWYVADKLQAEKLLGSSRTVFTAMNDIDVVEIEKKGNFDLGYGFVLASKGDSDRFDLLFQKNTDGSDSAAYIASARSQLESYADLWDIRMVSNETITLSGHTYTTLEMVLQNQNTLWRYFYMTTLCDGYFVTLILTTSVADFRFEDFISSLESSSQAYYGTK